MEITHEDDGYRFPYDVMSALDFEKEANYLYAYLDSERERERFNTKPGMYSCTYADAQTRIHAQHTHTHTQSPSLTTTHGVQV